MLLVAAGCSNDPAPAAPSTPTPPAGGGSTAPTCTYALSPAAINTGPSGGTSTVTVTTQSGCAWTSSTSASFITVTSGASGSGTGTVGLNVAANPGADRTGTVTIAGQTLTVNQTGSGIIVGFNMLDPNAQTGTVTACLVRGPTFSLSVCPLLSTARTTGTNTLTNWAWTIRYTYDGQQKTQTQTSGTLIDFQFSEYCGSAGATAGGTTIPITVSLTVTDSNGVTATATSGLGVQPALAFVAYTCSP
jgi:hypothetical protein